MKEFLAIDVGGTVLGWALFQEGALVQCGLSRTKAKDCRQRAQDHVSNIMHALGGRWPTIRVVEMGDWRGKTTKRKMSPQQLADFNLIAGHVGTMWFSVAEWKGGTAREVEQPRTRAALSPAELAVLDAVKPTSLAHNACSAVGIGLFKLSRAHGPRSYTCPSVESPTTPTSAPRKKRTATKRTSRSKTSASASKPSGRASRTKSSRTKRTWSMAEAIQL